MFTKPICVLSVLLLVVCEVLQAHPFYQGVADEQRSPTIEDRSDKVVKNDTNKSQKPITVLFKIKRPGDVEEEDYHDSAEVRDGDEDGPGASYVGHQREHDKDVDDNVSANFEDIIDESKDDNSIIYAKNYESSEKTDTKDNKAKITNADDVGAAYAGHDADDGRIRNADVLGATYANSDDDDHSVRFRNADHVEGAYPGKDYERIYSTDDVISSYFNEKKEFDPENMEVRVLGSQGRDVEVAFDKDALKNVNKIFERVASGRQRRSRLYYNPDNDDSEEAADELYDYGEDGEEDEEDQEEEEEHDEERRRRREIRDAVDMVDDMDIRR